MGLWHLDVSQEQHKSVSWHLMINILTYCFWFIICAESVFMFHVVCASQRFADTFYNFLLCRYVKNKRTWEYVSFSSCVGLLYLICFYFLFFFRYLYFFILIRYFQCIYIDYLIWMLIRNQLMFYSMLS